MENRKANQTSVLASAFILLFVLSLSPLSSMADDITWSGISGNWNVPGNWNLNRVPSAGDNVSISVEGAAVELNTHYFFSGPSSMTIGGSGAGATLNNNGYFFTTSGDLVLGESSGTTGAFNLNNGGIYIKDNTVVGESGTGIFNQSGGTHSLDNKLVIGGSAGSAGTYNLNNGTLNVGDRTVIGEHGTGIFNQSGGTQTVHYELIIGRFDGSSGVLNITGGEIVSEEIATVGAFAGSSGSVLVDASSWTTEDLLSIGVAGTGAVTVQNGGELTAGSMVIGSNGSLTVDPEVVKVLGDFTLEQNGVLTLDIAGVTPDLISQLDIGGNGLFKGIINFNFTNGFAPTAGDSFDLIHVGGEADFSSAIFEIGGLAPGFEYGYGPGNNGMFTLNALNSGVIETTVPEPSSLWLLGSALLILFVVIRKKRSMNPA